MNSCDEYAIKTLRYLDEDLEGRELEDFLSHLDSCAQCREHLEAEKELSATLHRTYPLYSAPATLRNRLAASLIENVPLKRGPTSVYRRVSRVARERLSGTLQLVANWRVLVPAAVAIVLCLEVVPGIERRVQAASYIETAVAKHQNYLDGDLRPALESSAPEQVTAWFRGKVPFDFRLPAAESAPQENPAYRLTGATLVNFKGGPAALVTYQRQNDKISLLVDSSRYAAVAGGDEIRFGQADFSLSHELRLQGDYVEQSWSLVCFGFVPIRFCPRILPGLSSEHGRQQ